LKKDYKVFKRILKSSLTAVLLTVGSTASPMSESNSNEFNESMIQINFRNQHQFEEINSKKKRKHQIEIDLKSKFMNDEQCDIIIDKEFLEICYDYELKTAKSVSYTLMGDLVNETNIQERPSFYEEESLDEDVRASYSDYTNTGYDRGHMAPDAAFDWSQESLDATYSLANIIPQIPYVNRAMWIDVESYARAKAIDLGEINVINIVKYSDDVERIGLNEIAVSNGFYKVLYNEIEEFEECYYYANEEYISESEDVLENHKVECTTVAY
jgi:endonuclease G